MPRGAYGTTGRQVVEASGVRVPVRSCTSTQSVPLLTSRKCSGLPRSRPVCGLSMISKLSLVNASSASLTGAPCRAPPTVRASSARLSLVGLSMTAGASGCAKEEAHADNNWHSRISDAGCGSRATVVWSSGRRPEKRSSPAPTISGSAERIRTARGRSSWCDSRAQQPAAPPRYLRARG